LDNRNKQFYKSYRFSTLVHPYLTEIYPSWCTKVNNKNNKILPNNINILLTDVAIAYWLMGDDTYNKSHKLFNFVIIHLLYKKYYYYKMLYLKKEYFLIFIVN
jgi:hypothetical protein